MQIYGKRKYNAKKLRKIKHIYRNCNYSCTREFNKQVQNYEMFL